MSRAQFTPEEGALFTRGVLAGLDKADAKWRPVLENLVEALTTTDVLKGHDWLPDPHSLGDCNPGCDRCVLMGPLSEAQKLLDNV